MEVSRRHESFNIDSGRVVICCQPCQNDNESETAEGYCENCNEFLCTSCIKAHQKLTITKKHVIKTKDNMPTIQTQSDPCTDPCAVHKTEIVKFYCEEHDCVGCGDCMVLEHKSCKFQLVSDVSGNYVDSDELIRLRHTIEQLKINLNACKHKIVQSINVAEETKTIILAEIKQFRKEVNIYLDMVEADLIMEVEEIHSDNISEQEKLRNQCESMEIEIEEFKSNIEKCSDKINQLFVSSKQFQKRLLGFHEENAKISSKSKITTCSFEPSKDLMTLKYNISPLGKLSSQIKQFTGPCKKSSVGMKAHFKQKVNVQAKHGEKCNITGMVMVSSDDILVADHNNSFLKIVNIRQGIIKSSYKLPARPWDVAVITSDTAAVTLPFKGEIWIMDFSNELFESYSLNVRNGCCGIDHKNCILAVSFWYPPAVQVLDMTGNILHEVHDKTILNRPCYISLAYDNESMFVSDFGNNVVSEFTVDGHHKATIESQKLKRPAGLVATSDETVFVCGDVENGKVSMIVPETREILHLMLQGVEKPVSIILCEEQNKLFIGERDSSEDSCFLKIFDLK